MNENCPNETNRKLCFVFVAIESIIIVCSDIMAASEDSDYLGSWEEMADTGVCLIVSYIKIQQY